MTFLYEVIDGCRKALGPDLLLGVRLYDDMVDYSIGMNELKAIAPLLERTGAIDYLNVWQGAIPDPKTFADHWPSYYREPGQFVYKANEIKQLVNLPVPGRRPHRLPRSRRAAASRRCRRLGRHGPCSNRRPPPPQQGPERVALRRFATA